MADTTPISAFKFPPVQSEQFPAFDERRRASSASPNGIYPDVSSNERWTPRKDPSWGNGSMRKGVTRHGRQKSLSEAIRTIRGRHGSMSQNAQELAEALKAPVSPRLIVSHLLPMKQQMLTQGYRRSAAFGI